MACGVRCDGGVLIEWFKTEKIGREQSRLFFVVGMVGEGVAGVFQAAPDYPLSRLVSAFQVARNLPRNVSSVCT